MLRAHSRALALSVIPGEQPAHLDGGRQLAPLLEGGADRGGGLETTNMAGSAVTHAAASADYRA